MDFKKDGLQELYSNIRNVNKLRNLITHHNGNLIIDTSKTLREQNDYELFYLDDRLSILGSGQVFIDDCEYIQSFIKDCETFLNTIFIKLKNKD